MKKLKWILFIAVLAIIVSCSDDTPEEPDVPVVVPAQRTIIAYMDGNQVGNSLPQFLNLDIKEMAKGSDKLPADVNLVVFANIRGEKPYIAELAGGESTKVREWESNFLATNPDSMLSVMKWIIDKYPAYEYATIFGGHGTGSLVYTDTVATNLRRAYAYGWDYDNGKAIWMNSQTLGTVMSHLPHMKFIFFDCCLMQDIEVANNIQRYTDYIIAPVCETPITGAPYENIVPLLSTSDIETLCTDVINAYTEANGICISALRTSGITNLFNVTREAIKEIMPVINNNATVLYRNCIYYYRRNKISDPVLYELQDILYEQNQGHILSDATYQRFLDAISQCVFYKHFVTWWVSDPSVGINFNDFTVTDENFGGLSISRETIDDIIK